jgi:hypoxanthine phosphoribosyltransferase
MDAPVDRAWRLLDEADLICSAEQVEQAIVEVAARISAAYAERFPLVLCVMNGGVFFCGKLLAKLAFPLTLDYVHASRYGEGLSGRDIVWRMLPPDSVAGRHVIIVDDILDAGVTLRAIHDKVLEKGAASVTVAVLAEKHLDQAKPIAPDWLGLTLPDRFVFGCGLDAGGFWRNLPAIYAMKGA